jgi:hypothetical protein
MLLEEVLALALSHAAKTEQRIAELREKHRDLELVEGASGLAKVARSDIAHLERSLIEIGVYVGTLRKRLAEDSAPSA